MDPNLWELYREGDADDEVMAILRLHDPAHLPPGVRIVAQFGTIATCRLRRGDIVRVRALPQIASLKAPDPVIADDPGGTAANVDVVASDIRRPEQLLERGAGVVVGIVDWGLDFAHPNFRNDDGSTRLLALWDQQAEEESAKENRYGYGTIHERRDIDAALAAPNPYEALAYDPAAFDPNLTGMHGTHVCDIAAGNGSAGPSGIAPEADLVFVHLSARTGGFTSLGDSVTLLEAIDFIRSVAGARPCVINLSMGNMGGPHDGSTLVEMAIDNAVSGQPGFAICQSCGNYYERRAHAQRRLGAGEVTLFRWQTDPGDRTPNELEIWYAQSDQFSVRLIAPDGTASNRVELGQEADFIAGDQRAARIYHRRSDPNNHDHHIHIFLYAAATAGTWTVEVTAGQVIDGRLHAWIERDEGCRHCQSFFALEDVAAGTTTGTICNSYKTIAVAAYDGHAGEFAPGPFSSVGPTRDGRDKPDLCAPGVRVLAARSRVPGDPSALLTRKSGTSMAAPHVTGTVALMFEAARRPLPIDETRRIVTATADARDIPPELLPRAGAGRLDIAAAVAAARPSKETNMKAHCKCGGAEAAAESEPYEDVVGQVTAGGTQSSIDTAVAGGASMAGIDEALRHTIANATTSANWIVVGNLLGSGCDVMPWTPSAALPAPAVIDVDAATACVVIINGSVYVPSSVPAKVTRWVQIPRAAEFYALAAKDQAAQKQRWVRALWKARAEIGAALPGTTVTKAWLGALSMPALRLLLAQFAANALPVVNIDKPAKKQRGGLVNGVTMPLMHLPLSEPECYLPVIAGAEGKMEAVNTWDRGAGVSIGPIQFNAIGGHLFDFLGRLNDLDSELFRQELGTPLGWSVSADAGHVDLTVAAPAATLHGDGAHADDNAGFLQSGVAGNVAFNQIDAPFRRRIAAAFRSVVAWPHVQELIYLGCADYATPALAIIDDAANGIPPLDANNPSRSVYILRALLVSAYVRYSACLRPLLVALRRWTTADDKLAHIVDAVAGLQSPCPKLHDRLTKQKKIAGPVWKVIQRLRGETVAEDETEDDAEDAGEELELESFHEWEEPEELTPCGEAADEDDDDLISPDEAFARVAAWSPAELFDAFYGRTANAAHFTPFVEVVAAPGQPMPDLGPGDFVITRALGEGNLARVSAAVRSSETSLGRVHEVVEAAGAAPVARSFAERVPSNQIVFRLRTPAEDDPASATAPATISCGPKSSVSLHADLVTAIDDMRRLAGEKLPLVKKPCDAGKLCPTPYQGFHDTGDATHAGPLDTAMLRIAEIAGIWGEDVSALGKAKASHQVTMPGPYAPLTKFGAVAIRRSGVRELHVHRGAPLIESWVDGHLWKNLAVEHAIGLTYTLMKTRWWERSIHRQWGTAEAVSWIGHLCRFYKDKTGLRLGVGDISHIVGEGITDHKSHSRGLDVDLYVLEYPAGTAFPEAYWCEGKKEFSLTAMAPPDAPGDAAEYKSASGTSLGTREPDVWRRYATVLAYCLATWPVIEAFVWHGARALENDAVAIASDMNPQMSEWGLPVIPAKRAHKLVGVGHSAYGHEWPEHQNHIHVRLTF
jgi:subtilisin family serine protease